MPEKISTEEIKILIQKLLTEVEEEDVCISLLTTQYQAAEELEFFEPEDRKRVVKILNRLTEDSGRHKKILEKLVDLLGQKVGFAWRMSLLKHSGRFVLRR